MKKWLLSLIWSLAPHGSSSTWPHTIVPLVHPTCELAGFHPKPALGFSTQTDELLLVQKFLHCFSYQLFCLFNISHSVYSTISCCSVNHNPSTWAELGSVVFLAAVALLLSLGALLLWFCFVSVLFCFRPRISIHSNTCHSATALEQLLLPRSLSPFRLAELPRFSTGAGPSARAASGHGRLSLSRPAHAATARPARGLRRLRALALRAGAERAAGSGSARGGGDRPASRESRARAPRDLGAAFPLPARVMFSLWQAAAAERTRLPAGARRMPPPRGGLGPRSAASSPLPGERSAAGRRGLGAGGRPWGSAARGEGALLSAAPHPNAPPRGVRPGAAAASPGPGAAAGSLRGSKGLGGSRRPRLWGLGGELSGGDGRRGGRWGRAGGTAPLRARWRASVLRGKGEEGSSCFFGPLRTRKTRVLLRLRAIGPRERGCSAGRVPPLSVTGIPGCGAEAALPGRTTALPEIPGRPSPTRAWP